MRAQRVLVAVVMSGMLLVAPCLALADNAKVIAVTILDGQISVPEESVVQKSNNGIRWELSGPGTFADSGIVIVDPQSGYTDCKAIANGKKFHCSKAIHVPGGHYKYNVIVNVGGQLVTKDPFIRND